MFNTIWNYFRNRYSKKLGNTLCLAKWTQTNIYLATGKTHSCHHPLPHTISINEIKKNPAALHNTKFKIEQRQKMLNGERPSECDYCWRVEDSGHTSDRITKSFSNWSRPYFNEILKQGAEVSTPKYLEVSFDNTCNLKCSYCGPSYSSKWASELEQYGDWLYHHSTESIILNKEDNPYVEAFWKWWPSISKNLHTFRITGGEPLLSKHTYNVINYLKENPNSNLTLGINSNLSVPQDVFYNFIDQIKTLKLKKIIIHTSCDAYGSAAEYARHGLNYAQWLKNCQYVLKNLPNADLDIMVTYNIFSVTTFKQFLEDINILKGPWYKKTRTTVSISYLRNPSQLAVWVLPKEYTYYVDDQIEYMKKGKFTTDEINQLERIRSLFNNTTEDITELRRKFKLYVDEHDKRRNTNFLKSVPRMEWVYYES